MTLPSVVFWSAVAVQVVVRIRNEGLTIREALLALLGRSRSQSAYRRWHIAFAVVTVVGTLGLWAWLSAQCRASLT